VQPNLLTASVNRVINSCILVTAFGSDEIQQQVKGLDAVYLEKPISLLDLLNKVRAAETRKGRYAL
jgi:DNA-binding response OmpR family regulator